MMPNQLFRGATLERFMEIKLKRLMSNLTNVSDQVKAIIKSAGLFCNLSSHHSKEVLLLRHP